MSARLEGGPLDGAEIAEHSESFVFIAPPSHGAGAKPRTFAEAKPGRLLYRNTGVTYLYAALTHGPCGSCGAFMELAHGEKRAACELCGGEVCRVPTRAR